MKLKIHFPKATSFVVPKEKIIRGRIPRADCIRQAFHKMALTGPVKFSWQGSE
ncbi:MAG TPA: hypothetical protein VK815_07360 [Candidatus Acidoferrales bacterium]|jgi:hypothetical protein|nr:hypothetical protein [Candidatus Acidoferrales bacterium]